MERVEKIFKFGLVGISGIFVNMCVLWYLTEVVGLYYLVSSLFAIELSIINNFIWNDLWTIKSGGLHKCSSRLECLIAFNVISVGGLVINWGFLFLLTIVVGVYYLIANLIGILLAFSWNFMMNRRVTWQRV